MKTPEEILDLARQLNESLQAPHPEIPAWDKAIRQELLKLHGLLNVHCAEFAEGNGEKFVCPHGPCTGPLTVIVLGAECRFNGSRYCQACTATYLNRYSTLCSAVMTGDTCTPIAAIVPRPMPDIGEKGNWCRSVLTDSNLLWLSARSQYDTNRLRAFH
jgi:hypothetical protein